jgi:hypothetical protein
MKYCKCGSLLENGVCSNVNCMSNSSKRKDWCIDGCFIDFKKPVTYEEAKIHHEKLSKLFDEEFGEED